MADEQASAGLTPKLVDSLYVEAMLLADEARSYFDACGRDDRLSLDPVDRVGFSCESLKVTTRLMHIIAWLLTQKAVAAGELTRAQAGISERRLGDAPATDAEQPCGRVRRMADEQASAGLTPKLVDSLYVEAMLLADEARSYFDACGRDDRLSLDPVDRVGFSCESLKVTTRLMHIIAWLLTQKAVAAGELTPAQAGISERRLGDAPETDAELLSRLPEAAIALIRSSEDLYERVRRIDEGHFGGTPIGSPARSLLNRLQRSL